MIDNNKRDPDENRILLLAVIAWFIGIVSVWGFLKEQPDYRDIKHTYKVQGFKDTDITEGHGKFLFVYGYYDKEQHLMYRILIKSDNSNEIGYVSIPAQSVFIQYKEGEPSLKVFRRVYELTSNVDVKQHENFRQAVSLYNTEPYIYSWTLYIPEGSIKYENTLTGN